MLLWRMRISACLSVVCRIFFLCLHWISLFFKGQYSRFEIQYFSNLHFDILPILDSTFLPILGSIFINSCFNILQVNGTIYTRLWFDLKQNYCLKIVLLRSSCIVSTHDYFIQQISKINIKI